MRSIASRRARSVALALAALFLVGSVAIVAPAAAQPGDNSVEIHVEAFRPDFDSHVRFDSTEFGFGTELDLEQDLAMEEQTSGLRAEVAVRGGERARVTFEYLSFDRSGSATVGRTIQFGGTSFRANAELDSSLESQFFAAGWGYAIWLDEVSEFGLSLSVAWISLEASLSGQASLPGLPGLSVTVEEKGTAEGPVPMLGAFGAWTFAERFRLSGFGRYLEIEDLDGWSGSALDFGARFEWYPIDNLGLSVGYGKTDIEASSDEPRGLGRADYAYDGFRAGVTFAF